MQIRYEFVGEDTFDVYQVSLGKLHIWIYASPIEYGKENILLVVF